MDALEMQMISVVNRNHRLSVISEECEALAQRLNSISAKRRKKRRPRFSLNRRRHDV